MSNVIPSRPAETRRAALFLPRFPPPGQRSGAGSESVLPYLVNDRLRHAGTRPDFQEEQACNNNPSTFP